MSDYRDTRGCAGGVDSDSDIRDLDANDFLLESQNLSSGVSIKGTLLNIKGTTKINHVLPTGRNKVNGALRDIKRNAIIYFVFNDQGQHSILHFFCATNTIEEILAPSAALPVTGIPFDTSFLGFTEFNKIHSAFIIDDILVWTDGNVPPRKINIKYAKDFMLQLTPSMVNKPYNNLLATGIDTNKEQFVNFIKYPPLNPTEIALGTDATKNTNFIRNKMIQVRYRWIYDDSEKSRWSTGSFVSLPQEQENALGILANAVQNNYLSITYNTGHPTVRKIDIALRFGNNQNWMRLDEPINKFDDNNQQLIPDYTDEVLNFYGDRVLIPIDTAESDENYDAIPITTQTLEIIYGNRCVMANNTEGYQNPTLDVSIQFGNTLVPLNGDSSDDIKLYDYVTAGDHYPVLSIPFAQGNIQVGMVISFTIGDSSTFVNFDFNYTIVPADMANYPYSLRDKIFLLMTQLGINTSTTPVFIVPDVQAFYVPSAQPSTGMIFWKTTTITNLIGLLPSNKTYGFKHGTFQKPGIAYYDFANRDGGVATTPEFVQYIKTLPELFINGVAPVPLDDDNAYQSFLDIFIRHIPPIWAVKYQIVMAHNNLRKYLQFTLKGEPILTGEGNYELDLTYLIDYMTKTRITSSLNFQFEVGDRLRFIANASYYCPQYVEVTVLAFNTTNNKLTVGFYDKDNVIGNMVVKVQEGTLVEYFAYALESDEANQFYFERGEVFDIIAAGTANRRHAGMVDGVPSNQVPSLGIPAQIRLRHGDSYQYKRYLNTTTQVRIVESENFSDFYQSANFDISRVQGVRNEVTKQHGQQLRYGGKYFADTLTNNLNTFNGEDVDTLQTVHGNINKIINIGFVLKCLQTKKVTSIYIERQQLFNADGSNNVTLTDKVLGNKDPSNTDHGCIHPTSVCMDERQIYFYDFNSGEMIQDSANGLFPISNYKMVKGLKDKTQQINSASGNVFVYASVDNLISTLNISFVNEDDPLSIINDTYIYNTNDNRWKPRQSYIPDYVCSNALVFVSFKDGELYVHNSNELRNNFYGVQYDAVLVTVSNVQPTEVKVFDDMWQQSTKLFSCPNIGDLNILPTPNYPLGMQSRAVAGRWIAKEGKLYTDILRNALTSNQPSTSMALQNGDKMRGQALKVTLRNSDDSELTLYGIIINSTKSDIS